jgi:hypothetical protein
MPYEQIHCCPKGCVLFREEHNDAKYCPKCKSSRYVEVDKGDGKKQQNENIPMKVLRHLPIIPRLQRLFMSEEFAKQMTWIPCVLCLYAGLLQMPARTGGKGVSGGLRFL